MKRSRLYKVVLILGLLFTSGILAADFVGTCSNGEWYRVFDSYGKCQQAADKHYKDKGHASTCR
ncbi:MAG: hypothetical protein ABGY96_14135 [bacterium]|nr:hypothetical protein [Gammaproteobacteria bacterium]HIL98371.1 hypothetical protein [Pseudomonadales bacterium]